MIMKTSFITKGFLLLASLALLGVTASCDNSDSEPDSSSTDVNQATQPDADTQTTDSTFNGDLICKVFISWMSDSVAGGVVYASPTGAPIKVGEPVRFSPDGFENLSTYSIITISITDYKLIIPAQFTTLPPIYYYFCEAVPAVIPEGVAYHRMETAEIDGRYYMLYDVDPNACFTARITYVNENGDAGARLEKGPEHMIFINFQIADLAPRIVQKDDIIDVHVLSARYITPLDLGSPFVLHEYMTKACLVAACE